MITITSFLRLKWGMEHLRGFDGYQIGFYFWGIVNKDTVGGSYRSSSRVLYRVFRAARLTRVDRLGTKTSLLPSRALSASRKKERS